MDKVTRKDIEWLLTLNENGSRLQEPPSPTRSWKRAALSIAVVCGGLVGLTILPFFLLVRTSVYLKVIHGFTGGLALGGGAAATVLLLLAYLVFLLRKVRNRKRVLKYSLIGAGAMVGGFCLFSLFYLSGVHAKSPEVRDLYHSMHPILRVSVATVTLADGDLVITDIKRVPDDYNRMGLPVNASSLHYEQESGYVHAVDLRTRGHGAVRNFLLQASLDLMGFRTLRHDGTADHLHVVLPG